MEPLLDLVLLWKSASRGPRGARRCWISPDQLWPIQWQKVSFLLWLWLSASGGGFADQGWCGKQDTEGLERRWLLSLRTCFCSSTRSQWRRWWGYSFRGDHSQPEWKQFSPSLGCQELWRTGPSRGACANALWVPRHLRKHLMEQPQDLGTTFKMNVLCTEERAKRASYLSNHR